MIVGMTKEMVSLKEVLVFASPYHLGGLKNGTYEAIFRIADSILEANSVKSAVQSCLRVDLAQFSD